jgi:hypothetical protein
LRFRPTSAELASIATHPRIHGEFESDGRTKNRPIHALQSVDELSKEISRAGERSAEIRLFGGTAMMLQFPEREATLDVDCVVTSGHGAVMRAMPVVARRLGLPSGWLNEGVSVYRSRSETDDDFSEMFALPGRRPVLRVLAARPQYLMAMKISALGRGAARDRSDIAIAAESMATSTLSEIQESYRRYFSDGAEIAHAETISSLLAR